MIRTMVRTWLFPLAACALALAPIPAARAAGDVLPVPPLRLPVATSRTLPNGLRVVVFPVHRQPLVQVQLVVPAGAAQEPDSLPGLAALTAEFLRHGTTSRTVEQLDEALGRIGGAFSTWAGRDYAIVQCAAPAQGLERLLELMSDEAINPLFGGDGFAADLQAYGQKLQVQRQSLADFADQRAAEAAFAPHPYAHSAGTDIPAILAATPGQVQGFHRDHWRPDAAVLEIAGDVDPERAFALATDWFGNWSGHAAPERTRPAPRPHAGVRVVDMPGVSRIEVRAALVGPGVAQPGFPSWSLAQGALDAAALPPGVRSSLVPARDASLLMLSSTTSVAQAPAQARRMVEALRTFASRPPAGDALAAVRRRVAQSYPLGLETLGGFLGQWQLNQSSGLPADEVEHAGEHAAAADLAPVLPLLAASPVIVVVGPADSLRGPLAALGAVEVVPPDAFHANPPDTLPVPTAEESRRGRAAIAAAIAAHGGAAVLKGAHLVVQEGDEFIYSNGQELSGQFSYVRIDPDRFSVVNKMFKMESHQVLIGDHGWSSVVADSSVSSQLDSTGVTTLQAVFHGDLVRELRAASAPGAGPALRGAETIGGHACDLVDFAGPRGRERFAIDSATHRIVAIDGPLAPGPAWHQRRVLSDYRPVNGLLLPFIEDRSVDGERNSHVIYRNVLVNATIDMRLFNPPTDLGH
jgi:zinc protease